MSSENVLKLRFLAVKKRIIERAYERFNERQREAIFADDGQVLILAGAGSGKTSVIVNRIAFLLSFGTIYHEEKLPQGLSEFDVDLIEIYAENPSEEYEGTVMNLIGARPVRPYQILAVTFTNKAARELKERIVKICGSRGEDVNAGTFHSLCLRILRSEISVLDYTSDFTIYDTDDSKKVIRECIKTLRLDEKKFNPGMVLSLMGRAKDGLQSAVEFAKDVEGDEYMSAVAKIYKRYAATLKAANALDFDDLIYNTVKLLRENPQIAEKYQKRYRYVLIDEYQDTNKAQFMLTELLAGGYRNIMAVGDDDQSIYKFRGATIENILGFEKVHAKANIIRLEQNYRSTTMILNCANKTIKNNENRKGKTLWTDNGVGEKIGHFTAQDAYDEARFVANKILEISAAQNRSFADFAVLYRTNNQSAAIEEVFSKSGVSFRIFGALKFYERMEIKDLVAYLTLLVNENDNLRLKRVINVPKRAIGDTTVELLEKQAQEAGISMLAAARRAEEFPELKKVQAKLIAFAELIDNLRVECANILPSEALKKLVDTTGYYDYLRAIDNADGKDRLSNLDTLSENIKHYEEGEENPTVGGFLEGASLATDLDNLDEATSQVSVMTIHSAKGLEFPVVFITGMEEELFPSARSFDPAELEEERRLAYVAITRAKNELYLSNAKMRRTFSTVKYPAPSRFLSELPAECIEVIGGTLKADIQRASEFIATKKPNIHRDARQKTDKVAAKFTKGQLVKHRKFGEGIVVDVADMGGDQKLEIDFKTEGKKRLMANFAAAAMSVVE